MICTGIFFVLSFEATPSEFGLQNFLPYQIKGFVDFISNFNSPNSINPLNLNSDGIAYTKCLTPKTKYFVSNPQISSVSKGIF